MRVGDEGSISSAQAGLERGGAAERATAPEPAAQTGPLLPMIIGSALFMQQLDATAIANALPTMARAFHQNPLTLNLAITAYLLSTAVFLPVSGWIADRLGAKTVFQAAMIGFAVSSLGCGLAQSLEQIVIARVVQGMAGALMVPVGRLVLLRAVPKSELVRAMSFLTMPALLGPVLGPPVGGFIVTYLSWRWIFFFNLPVSLLGVVLTRRFMPDVRETVRRRFDLLGFVLSGIALAGLVFGLENVGSRILPVWAVALMLAVSAACGWLYLVHSRRTEHAVLDMRLLRIDTFRAAVMGGLFSRLVVGASPFLLALLFQLGFGLSAFRAGLLTFAAAAGSLLMKSSARPILARFGFKRVLIVNSVLVGATFAGYALFRPATPHWLIVFALLVGGFFRSLQFTSLQVLTFADIPAAEMSRATSFASVFQQLSQSLGVGVSALLVALVLRLHHGAIVGVADIAPVFLAIGLLSLLNLIFLIPLSPHAGGEVSQHKARSPLAMAGR